MTKAIDLASIPQTWTAFTPTVTGWGAGNGTWDSYYAEIGKTVIWRCKFIAGSTTTFAGSPTLTLPLTAKAGGNYYCPFPVIMLCAGSAFSGTGYLPTTTTLAFSVANAASTYGGFTTISSTVPATWASTNHFNFCVTYEAA